MQVRGIVKIGAATAALAMTWGGAAMAAPDGAVAEAGDPAPQGGKAASIVLYEDEDAEPGSGEVGWQGSPIVAPGPAIYEALDVHLLGHKNLRAGSVLVSIAAVMASSAAVMLALVAWYDHSWGGMEEELAVPATILMALSGPGFIAGFPLIATGVTRMKKAGKILAKSPVPVDLLEGKPNPFAAADAAAELPVDQERASKARALATAGIVIEVFSLAAMIASWAFFPVEDEYSMVAIIPASSGLHAIATPMMLAAYGKARKAAGLRASDGLTAAGWVMVSTGLTILPFSALIWFGAGIGYSATMLAGAIIGFAAFARVKRIAESASAGADAGEGGEAASAISQGSGKTLSIAPMVVPVPGGVTLGVGGVF